MRSFTIISIVIVQTSILCAHVSSLSTVYDDGAKIYTFVATPSSYPSAYPSAMATTTRPSAVPSVIVQPVTGTPTVEEETSLIPTLSSDDPTAAPTTAATDTEESKIFELGVYVIFLLGTIFYYGWLLYWFIG